jgi:hypothetical protein
MRITRAKGGTGERSVGLAEIRIPDLWHLASALKEAGCGEQSGEVLECWHLAHDLLSALRELAALSQSN